MSTGKRVLGEAEVEAEYADEDPSIQHQKRQKSDRLAYVFGTLNGEGLNKTVSFIRCSNGVFRVERRFLFELLSQQEYCDFPRFLYNRCELSREMFLLFEAVSECLREGGSSKVSNIGKTLKILDDKNNLVTNCLRRGSSSEYFYDSKEIYRLKNPEIYRLKNARKNI
jgi:hypothetical protein